MRHTEVKVCDLKDRLTSFCPVAIYINDCLEWDDDDYKPNIYDKIFERTDFVTDIKIQIVHFHHSIISIYTVNED